MPTRVVVDMLLNWRQSNMIILPDFKNIPYNVVYQLVHYDPQRDSFYFILLHESFEIVSEGEAVPEIDFEKFERVEIEVSDYH